jgi:hypothetical protein
MTLLSIAQDVADMVGLARPGAIATGTDQLSRQLLAFAKETLCELAGMEGGWPVLEKQYTFPTVAGQDAYPLPADFQRVLGDTVYLASQYYQMRGSLSPSDWARQRGALPSQIGRYKVRFFGDPVKLYITPVPHTVETVTFEYVTTSRVIQQDGTRANDYSADTDVSLVPEELVKKGIKWRVRRAKGLDYSEEFNDYEISRQRALSQALAFGSVPVAVLRGDEYPEISAGYVPETGFGS